MTPQDFARIYALAFPESRPWTIDEFEALLASEHCFWVGDSRGFALGRAVAGESELLTIAVIPEFQQKGHGRRLLGLYHDKASDFGCEEFFLEVAQDNTAAIGLYKSTGYKISSQRTGYYTRSDGTSVDALLMTRPAVLNA